MQYGNAYVASVVLYDSYSQVLRALNEADAFNGPSIVLVYAPSFSNMEYETNEAVSSGYWPLYRYNPLLEDGDIEPENLLVPVEVPISEADERLCERLKTTHTKGSLLEAMDDYTKATGAILSQNKYNTTRYMKFTCESHAGCPFEVCFDRKGDCLSEPNHIFRHRGDLIEVSSELIEDVALQTKVQGQKYAEMRDVCKGIEDHYDELCVEITKPRNTRLRVQYACNQHIACPFSLSIQCSTRGDLAFSSKSNFIHTPTHYQGKHRRKNCDFLDDVIARCATRTVGLAAGDIIKTAEADNGKIVSYTNTYNAKQRYEKRAKLSADATCELIEPWLEEMKRVNERTYIAYLRDPDTQEFQKALISFGAMQVVAEKSLPIIVPVLDAAHMKGPQHGIMNAATIVTGNNENLVIATAVQACTESEESWSWFLNHLLGAYPALRTKVIVVISDRDKGLLNACKIFENAPQSFCTVHIRNVKSSCRVDLGSRVHILATEFNGDILNETWKEISEISPDAEKYLKGIGDESWLRSAFPRRRYGIVASNPAEISNSWLDRARHGAFFACLVNICDKMTFFACLVNICDKTNVRSISLIQERTAATCSDRLCVRKGQGSD